MLRNYNEQDFYELKSNTLINFKIFTNFRLLWALLFIFSIMLSLPVIRIQEKLTELSPGYVVILIVHTLLFVVVLMFTIFFSFRSTVYKFQLFFAVYLCATYSILSLLFSYIVIIVSRVEGYSDAFLFFYCSFVLGGILFFIKTLYVLIKKVKDGQMRRGGAFVDNRFYLKILKNYVTTFKGPFLFLLISLTIGLFAFPIVHLRDHIYQFALTFFIQYHLAYVLPELFLYTYCMFRFESFRLEAPLSVTDSYRIRSVRNNHSIRYWWNKPLRAMKSRSGWIYQDRAPFWVYFLIFLEWTFIICLSLVLLITLGNDDFVSQLKADIDSFLIVSALLSFTLIIVLRIILLFIQVLKRFGKRRS